MKNRAIREEKVIAQMVSIYCRHRHKSSRGALCEECSELLAYARKRLKKCPIDPHTKSSCRLCKIHCYDHLHAERVRQVMRYSGKWMLLYNPIMAIRHLLDER